MDKDINRGDTPISTELSPYYRRVHYSDTPSRIKELAIAVPDEFHKGYTMENIFKICAPAPTDGEKCEQKRRHPLVPLDEVIPEGRHGGRYAHDRREVLRSCIFHDMLYGSWVTQGAPLFEIGPLMSREFSDICETKASLSLKDGVPPEICANAMIDKVFSRLPFDVAYFKSDAMGFGVGCYALKFSFHEEVDYLLLFADTGARLIGGWYHNEGDGWQHAQLNMGELAELKKLTGYKSDNLAFTKHYDEKWHESSDDLFQLESDCLTHWVGTLCGLCYYLEAVNKDVVDTTHKVKSSIFSGKKSKIRKALNSMVGKQKIWIERSLEEKARDEGVTSGGKLSAGHIRRGHLHTYYTGKKLDADGNPLPKDVRKKTVKWVAPTWVGPRTLTEEPREYGIRAQQS